MNEISIKGPPGSRVLGAIVESPNPADLSQDMVEVQLPSGVLIDAGWVPEQTAHGSYMVSVTKGMDMLRSPYYTKSAREAATLVEVLAESFSSAAQPGTASNATTSASASIRQVSSVAMQLVSAAA